jgi:hypothetical protein
MKKYTYYFKDLNIKKIIPIEADTNNEAIELIAKTCKRWLLKKKITNDSKKKK